MIGDVFSKGEDYMPTMTPLMYAARLNQYDVIKVMNYSSKHTHNHGMNTAMI